MSKLWKGRTEAKTSVLADKFNSSINIDKRMYKEDIEGSIAHVAMLSHCKIVTKDECDKITKGLKQILNDINNGKIKINTKAEDIHMFVEEVLTKRIGVVGKKLHTARSRNDQVALDIRLNLRKEIIFINFLLDKLITCIVKLAKNNENTIMSGFTHLQKAQPITFAHYILAYAMMFNRDMDRLKDCFKRLNVSPIGACALAGTTYKTDRKWEAKKLGFDSVCENSIDAVSDRDFVIELASDISMISMHLSRLAEELILFTSNEFSYIELSDALTTGSSIMPQKKNSDMAELVRGKAGRVYGNLMTLLTMLKGLPLAYNKDMQEDKEAIFDSVDTIKDCIDLMFEMLSTMKINVKRMRDDANSGFINATDLADYLVKKGLAFRDAYNVSGKIVKYCIEKEYVLENLPIEIYKKFENRIEKDVYDFIKLETCVKKRTSYGGTSQNNLKAQYDFLKISSTNSKNLF